MHLSSGVVWHFIHTEEGQSKLVEMLMANMKSITSILSTSILVSLYQFINELKKKDYAHASNIIYIYTALCTHKQYYIYILLYE